MQKKRQPASKPKPQPKQPNCIHRKLTPDGKRCADCDAQIYL